MKNLHIENDEFLPVYRTTNDVNGNSRFVVPFIQLFHVDEYTALMETTTLEQRYKLAVKRANKIGGRKYHTKNFGGGIVFATSLSAKQLGEYLEKLRTKLKNGGKSCTAI